MIEVMEFQPCSSTGFPIKWTMLVQADAMVVSRKVPREVLETVGFIEWNRFCDRLDQGLEPLRSLSEKSNHQNDCCQFMENSAKAKALQVIQETCDKLSQRASYLQFTLYCPFHCKLTENWHIQAMATELPPLLSTDVEAPTQIANEVPHSESDNASDETTDASTTESRNDNQDTGAEADNSDASNAQDNNVPSAEVSSFRRRNSSLGVLGVDYIEHELRPTDTLNGICLAYSITPSKLKQANLVLTSDNDSLVLAPKILAIPISDGVYSRVRDTSSEDYKLFTLMKKFPKLGTKEAKA
jgi:hypothetical protein